MLSTSSDSLFTPFTDIGGGHITVSPSVPLSEVPCMFDSPSPGFMSDSENAEPEWIHGRAGQENEGGQSFYVHRISFDGVEKNIEKFLRWRELCRDCVVGDVFVSVSEVDGHPEVAIKRPYFPGPSVLSILSKMSVKEKLLCLFDVAVQLTQMHEVAIRADVKLAHGNILLSNIFKDEANQRYFITDEFLFLFEPQNCLDVPCAWDQCLLRSNNTRKDSLNLQYLSPSVLEKGSRCFESDVYSFGVLVYHIFNKVLPFPFNLNRDDIIVRMRNIDEVQQRLRIPGGKACIREIETRMKILMKFCLDEKRLNNSSMSEVRKFICLHLYKFLIPEDEPRIFWRDHISRSNTRIVLETPMENLIREIRLSWEPSRLDPKTLGYDEQERKLRVLLEYASSYDDVTDVVTIEKFNKLYCWFGKFFLNGGDLPEDDQTEIREEFRKHIDATIDRCFDLIYVRSAVLTSPQVKENFMGHAKPSDIERILRDAPPGTYIVSFNPNDNSSVKNFPFVIRYSSTTNKSSSGRLSSSFSGASLMTGYPTLCPDFSSSSPTPEVEIKTAYLARFNTGFITENPFFAVTFGLSSETGDGAIDLVKGVFQHPFSEELLHKKPDDDEDM